jgi:vacuolar protein sorting-associated protein 51
MSTIASPRDTSVNGGRRIPVITTPTSSSRTSLENPRSADPSPNRAATAQPRRNRAALREYYNLKNVPEEQLGDGTSEVSSIHDFSEVQESEMDRADFDAPSYIKHILETQSLGELLQTYNGVLTDIRALDAERKALVYDNYSKLITATETIRKMREKMDPLNPVATTLDPAIASIYARAEAIKDELRESMPEAKRREMEMGEEERKEMQRKKRRRDVVLRVLETPEKVRGLVKDGREEEAKKLWETTLALLERWKERGVGGEDVQDCIDDGEAALRGEPPNEKSWSSIKVAIES